MGRDNDAGVYRWMIQAYIRAEKPEAALEMYKRMQLAGFDVTGQLKTEIDELAAQKAQVLAHLAGTLKGSERP